MQSRRYAAAAVASSSHLGVVRVSADGQLRDSGGSSPGLRRGSAQGAQSKCVRLANLKSVTQNQLTQPAILSLLQNHIIHHYASELKSRETCYCFSILHPTILPPPPQANIGCVRGACGGSFSEVRGLLRFSEPNGRLCDGG